MKIAFVDPGLPKSGALVVGVLADKTLLPTAELVDDKSGGAVSRAMAASRFSGKAGQVLELLAPAGLGVSRVILYGFGKAAKVDALRFEAMGGEMTRRLAESGETALCIACDTIKGAKLGAGEAAAHVAYGVRLGSYRFD